MAIDDVSFTNLRGEVISRNNLVQEMINYYQLKINEGSTSVTDFNEGSEIRNLLESFAVDIYYLMEVENDILKNCFVDTADGIWLDKIGLHPFVNLPRNEGTVARGEITFSIPSALTSDVNIPANILLLGDNGLYYMTEDNVTIVAGDTSTTANATSVTVGKDCNCDANTITTIDDSYLNNDSISANNNTAFVDGTDYEDDEIYRQRLLDFVRADDFGSVGYYERLCNEVSGVHDVKLIDVSSYTKKVLVNGNTKPTPDSVLLDVLTVLSDLGNTVMGHTFTVDKPSYTTIPLDIDITVINEMDTDKITTLLSDFFDGGEHLEGFEFSGLNIDEGITEQTLYGLFGTYDNILSVEIESGGSPVTDIDCPLNNVLKLGTVNITQTIAE